MKKTITFLILLLPLLSIAQGIKFEEGLSWEQIKQKAKQENKYIFVDCYATWCGPCKRMDGEVYPDEKVGTSVNDKFIAVKVQMDKTKKDDKKIISWYDAASQLSEQFKVEGYPTFLFLSPDSRLVWMDLGYKSVNEFITLVEKALDPQSLMYYTQYTNYKSGKKEVKPGQLSDLALYTKKVIKDKDLAEAIAFDYKMRVLNKRTKAELSSKQYLLFINEFSSIISTNDKIFHLLYTSPSVVDSILNRKGWADSRVKSTIIRDELESKLFRKGKPVYKNPPWVSIQKRVKSKYLKIDIDKLILKYQVSYYRRLELWATWFNYKEEWITKYPPARDIEFVMEFNDGGAWDVFLHCNDKNVLTKSLKWIDTLLTKDSSHPHLDTKANLLYKVGKFNEAIAYEEKAINSLIEKSKKEKMEGDEFYENNIALYKMIMSQMKKREPTYLHEGAIWTKETLPFKLK